MDLSKVVEDETKVDLRFLYFLLLTNPVRRFMKDHASGSTVLHLQTRAVPNLTFDIPTFKPEQAKIAEVLSTVDRAIAQTEALIAKQQRIKAGLMHDLLTRGIDEHGTLRSEETHAFKDSPLGRIPAEWGVVKLQHTCRVIDSLHRTPTFSEEGYAMVRVTDIKPGKLSLHNCVRVSGAVFEDFTRNHVPGINDIVMSRVGTYGVSSLVCTEEPFCLGQNTVVITGHDNSNFLFEFLQTPMVRAFYDLQLAGSSQKTLSLQAIRETPTPSVPREEMNQISNILVAQNEAVLGKTQNLIKLRSLKTALMQDLLTGTRRVTALLEPEDASV